MQVYADRNKKRRGLILFVIFILYTILLQWIKYLSGFKLEQDDCAQIGIDNIVQRQFQCQNAK